MTEGSGSQVHSQLMPRPWRALSPETGKPQDPGEIEKRMREKCINTEEALVEIKNASNRHNLTNEH